MCKYSDADFERAAKRLETANSSGDAATVRRFLKDFSRNVTDKKRTAKIIKICRGVLENQPVRNV